MNRPVLIGVGGAREPAEAIDLMVLAAERAVGSEWARAKTEGSGGEGLKGAEKKKKPRIVEV